MVRKIFLQWEKTIMPACCLDGGGGGVVQSSCMEQKEWMTDMMTNNTDILYTSVQLNALCTILYLISKVSTTVPK